MSENEEIVQETEQPTGVQPETTEATEKVEAQESQEETVTSEEDADQGEEKPKRRSRAEERINALTRERYERDQQIAAQQQQLEQMQKLLQEQQMQPGKVSDDMPRLADFGYDEPSYQAAMQEWNQRQIQTFQEQQTQQAEQQRQVAEEQRIMRQLQEKVEAATKKYPDFREKVFDPTLPPLRQVNPVAFQTVVESDAGDDVAYYLASNPQELYRLADMNPMQTVREMTLLEARLKAAPPQQVQTPPKPPSTLSEGSSEPNVDPENMTSDEWLQWRNHQLQSKQR